MRLSNSLSEAMPKVWLEGGDRYAANWNSTSRKARKLCPTCCWCAIAPSTETHHAMYWDDAGAILGREVPGVHVFPVCAPCHESLHTRHWFAPEDHLARRNTPSAIAKLTKNWEDWAKGARKNH